MGKIKKGMRVRFIENERSFRLHKTKSHHYPRPNSLGTVVCCDIDRTTKVKWDEETSGKGEWWVATDLLSPIAQQRAAKYDRCRDFEVGDKVRFNRSEVCRKMHKHMPRFYPNPDTRGVIIGVSLSRCFVQWTKGSTSNDDKWFVDNDAIRKVDCND